MSISYYRSVLRSGKKCLLIFSTIHDCWPPCSPCFPSSAPHPSAPYFCFGCFLPSCSLSDLTRCFYDGTISVRIFFFPLWARVRFNLFFRFRFPFSCVESMDLFVELSASCGISTRRLSCFPFPFLTTMYYILFHPSGLRLSFYHFSKITRGSLNCLGKGGGSFFVDQY